MQIIEIYKSLQGESSYAGLPCVFVRLRDATCAAPGATASTPSKAARDDAGEIEAEVRHLLPDGGLVEITGGEPMLQERDVVPLMDRLLAVRLHRAARDQRRATAGQSARGAS